MIIFPAIDILGDKCVRLNQGRYDAVTVYCEDPSEQAKVWQSKGAMWLHVVDLDGARDGRPVNLRAVEKLAAKVDIPIQFGGGVRTREDIKRLYDLGVTRVVLGSSLIKNRSFANEVIAQFGERVVAGIDGRDGRVAIDGWEKETQVQVVDLSIEFEKQGVERIIYTDITVDGTRKGPNIEATRALAQAVGIPVIASGGVSTPADIECIKNLFADGVEGVIIGSALYEKTITLEQALQVANS